MWPSFKFPTDLVTFTEKTLNGKLHFLCSGYEGKNDEIRAVCGAGDYVLSPEYKSFRCQVTLGIPRVSQEKKDHVTKSYEYEPSIDDTFTKPPSSGQRPGL